MINHLQINNPIHKELLKLKLINNKNLKVINHTTRDKKILVLQDKKTKIIFLNEYIPNEDFFLITKNNKKKIANIKTRAGLIKTSLLDDNQRRVNQFDKLFQGKVILDFGCGWGDFLKLVKNAKKKFGLEPRKDCNNHIKKKLKSIKVLNKLGNIKKKFDIITLFHVLEHLPYQIKVLKSLKSKLRKNGKLIIEVPHAEDFLIKQKSLEEFKNFTFISRHLILHTVSSLKKILKASGFKKIKISFYQRYGFANALGWFLDKKPGGHNKYVNLSNSNLEKEYAKNLIKLKQTDTLIAIAEI